MTHGSWFMSGVFRRSRETSSFFGSQAFFLTVFKGVLWGIGVAVGVSVLMIASWSFFSVGWENGRMRNHWIFSKVARSFWKVSYIFKDFESFEFCSEFWSFKSKSFSGIIDIPTYKCFENNQSLFGGEIRYTWLNRESSKLNMSKKATP